MKDPRHQRSARLALTHRAVSNWKPKITEPGIDLVIYSSNQRIEKTKFWRRRSMRRYASRKKKALTK
jgi:hypothetical protein